MTPPPRSVEEELLLEKVIHEVMNRVNRVLTERLAREGNGLSLSGYGASLHATGRDVILVLLLLVGFSAVSLVTWDGFRKVQATLDAGHAQHAAIQQAQDDLSCILTLAQDQRGPALFDRDGICHYARMMVPPERRR